MTFLRRLVGFTVTACALATSMDALAQRVPLSETLIGEEKAAYDAALALFQGGDYQGALAKFGRAYELSHNPRLLWNMAVCEKHQHHYASAGSYIQRHLDDAKDLSSQERASAVEALTAVESLFSYAWVTDAPPGASIVVDEKLTHTAPLAEPLRLDLGTHTLTVSKGGYQTRSQQLDVVGGGQLVVDGNLTELPLDKPQAVFAQLKITTSGEKDVVSVDGDVVGSHSWEGPVTPGSHTIRVTGSDKITYERTVHVKSNSTRTLHVVLEDERSHTWYWLAGGTVLAVAGMGGYLLLRPDESDGPTGSLTTVYLP